MNAETAYLFRHALMRDAAYQLQPPAQRARLHAITFEIVEQTFRRTGETDSLDNFAAELAGHAHQARLGVSHETPEESVTADAVLENLAPGTFDVKFGAWPSIWHKREAHFLWRAAQNAQRRHQHLDAQMFLARLCEIPGLTKGLKAHALCAAASAAERAGDIATMGRRASMAAESSGGALRLHARRMKGMAENLSGRVNEAEAILSGVLAEAKAAGNALLISQLSGNLGALFKETGRAQEAQAYLREALRISQERGAERDAMVNSINLAGALAATGAFLESERLYLAALTTARKLRERRIEGIVLGNMSGLFSRLGNRDENMKKLAQAIEILGEVGDGRTQAIFIANLASALSAIGKHEQALPKLDVAIASHREFGNKAALGAALYTRANILLHLDRVDESLAHYRQALQILIDVSDRYFEAEARAHLAVALLHRMDFAAAEAEWQIAEPMVLAVQGAKRLEEMRSDYLKAKVMRGAPAAGNA